MTGQLVAVLSRKGGVGKSMLTAALGARWAAQGKRVVLVDMSSGRRSLDMLLGLESRIVFDLGDVLEGVCGLDRAMVADRQSGVSLLAAAQADADKPLNARTLQIILEVLCLQNDYVLLDTPCGLAAEQLLAARLATRALLVTTPDDLCLRESECLALAIRAAHGPTPWLVVNRLEAALVSEGLQYTPEVCAQVLDLPVLGVIPEDGCARREALARNPALGTTAAAQAIDNLMARLEDPSVPLHAWAPAPAGDIDVPEAPDDVTAHDADLDTSFDTDLSGAPGLVPVEAAGETGEPEAPREEAPAPPEAPSPPPQPPPAQDILAVDPPREDPPRKRRGLFPWSRRKHST